MKMAALAFYISDTKQQQQDQEEGGGGPVEGGLVFLATRVCLHTTTAETVQRMTQ